MEKRRNPLVLGVDVSSQTLDGATWPESAVWRYPRHPEGLAALAVRAQELNPRLVVLAVSDGLEAEVATELARSGLPVAVVDPRQTQQFARSIGLMPRTGQVGAIVLARFGAFTGLKADPFKDSALRVFNEVVERRRQLLDMLTMERHRLSTVRGRRVIQDLKAHIAWLEKRQRDIDNELRKRIKESPAWRVKDDLLQNLHEADDGNASHRMALQPGWRAVKRRRLDLVDSVMQGLRPIDRGIGGFLY